MSQLIQQKFTQMLQVIDRFTLQSDALILQLYATDHDDKLAFQALSLYAQNKKDSPDITLLVSEPFNGDVEHFAKLAIVELCRTYEQLIDTHLPLIDDPKGHSKAAWSPEFLKTGPDGQQESALECYLRLLNEFIGLYGAYFDKLLLAYVPFNGCASAAWQPFIGPIIKQLNTKMRLIVLNNLTPIDDTLKTLDVEPRLVMAHAFQGQSFDMMLDVINRGDGDDPWFGYKQALVKTFQYQQKEQPQQAFEMGEQVVKCASEQGFLEGQIIGNTLLYACSVSLGDFTLAEEKAHQAVLLSEQVTPEQLAKSETLQAISYANLGTAALLNHHDDTALQAYIKSGELFEGQHHAQMAYETYRLAVSCAIKQDKFEQAWCLTQDAFIQFYQTPEALWPDSTLLYLAQDIDKKFERWPQEEKAIYQAHLTDLLGQDWPSQLAELNHAQHPQEA